MATRWIHKIGAAVLDGDRLLVVRKRDADIFILPGGKPEGAETDLETLAREIDEELGCGVARPNLVGTFKDVAAGVDDAVVVVRLYATTLVGDPAPLSEIVELRWTPLRGDPAVRLAPSIVNGVLPHLRRRLRSAGASPDRGEHPLQGAFEIV